jgi:hypothetical protein
MAELPERIFKYVSSERIDILEKLLIRFTQPACFNDPFEARIPVEGYSPEKLDRAFEIVKRRNYQREVVSGKAENLSFEQFDLAQDILHHYKIEKLKFDPLYQKQAATNYDFKKRNKDIGILSLSESEKDLPMWAYYADSHRGMLVEFYPRHPFFNAPNLTDAEFDFGMLVPVDYRRNRPKKHVGKTSVLEEISMLRVKSGAWEHEKEWRVFQHLARRHEQIPTKENEIVYLFKLPPDCIKRVVVGHNMDYLKRKKVVDAINANPQLKDVKIEESVLHLDLFELEYRPLLFPN